MFLHPVDDLVDPTEFFLLRFGPQCAANRAFGFAGVAKMPDKLMSARSTNGRLMRPLEMGARSCQQHQAASRDCVKFTLQRPAAGGFPACSAASRLVSAQPRLLLQHSTDCSSVLRAKTARERSAVDRLRRSKQRHR